MDHLRAGQPFPATVFSVVCDDEYQSVHTCYMSKIFMFQEFHDSFHNCFADPDQTVCKHRWSGSTLVSNALRLVILEQCSFRLEHAVRNL